MDLKGELEELASRIITESQGDDYHGMPLLIGHYYDYNGNAAYSNTPIGRYPLVDYQQSGGYCQIEVGNASGPWIVKLTCLTYFGPCKESLATNEGAIHLLKGEPI
jgi:hypothetical protein